MSSIVPFDPTTDWPDPDLSIGQPIRPPAPTMTDAEWSLIFGPWADWLKDAAEVKNAPIDYVAISLIVTAGSVMGNSRWASPWTGWKEPPVLWGMCIGDPSSSKSPALDAVADGLREIEREFSATYTTEKKAYDKNLEVANLVLSAWKSQVKQAMANNDTAPAKPQEADAGDKPIRERISITDITIEKVADLLSATWRGLLLNRDELAGWLGGMDRYNGGGDRPFWLEAYGGRSYSIDRKNTPEPIMVDHLSVAILGTTQPDKLDELLLNSSDDGLLARFIAVYPETTPIKRPERSLDDAKLIDAVKRLRELQQVTDDDGKRRPFFVYFTEDAAEVLQDFRRQCREWEQDAESLFKSHIGKFPGFVVRISNILAHLDWAAGDNADHVSNIEKSHVARACHFVGEYLRPHAYRAYGAAKLPAEINAAKSVAEVIKKEKIKRFKARDIQNRKRSGLTKAPKVKAALGILIEAGWIREIKAKQGGRPAITYAVNPKLRDPK